MIRSDVQSQFITDSLKEGTVFKMAKVIGIDLGTTNSVVSIMEGGEPVSEKKVRKAEKYKNQIRMEKIG